MTRNSAASVVLSCAPPASTIAVAAAMAGRMSGRSATASWKRRSRSSGDRPAMPIPRVRCPHAFCRSRYFCTTAQSGSTSGTAPPIPDRAVSCRAATSNSPRHNGAITMSANIGRNCRVLGVRSRRSIMVSLPRRVRLTALRELGRASLSYTRTSFWFLIGRSLTRMPVAAKTALVTAGATGGTPGSPRPPRRSPEWMNSTWTRGASAMRIIW